MGKWDELAWMDATAQGEMVRRKEVQPKELLEAAIERLERLKPALNAVVTPLDAEARNRPEKAPGTVRPSRHLPIKRPWR